MSPLRPLNLRDRRTDDEPEQLRHSPPKKHSGDSPVKKAPRAGPGPINSRPSNRTQFNPTVSGAGNDPSPTSLVPPVPPVPPQAVLTTKKKRTSRSVHGGARRNRAGRAQNGRAKNAMAKPTPRSKPPTTSDRKKTDRLKSLAINRRAIINNQFHEWARENTFNNNNLTVNIDAFNAWNERFLSQQRVGFQQKRVSKK